MTTTIPTDLPRGDLYSIVHKVHAAVRVGDKHPRSREERQKEAEMLMGKLGHNVKKRPSKAQLNILYDKGGKIVLESENGQSINYLIK